MPNTPVQAAAEGLPKFSLSQIMSAAWAHYRDIRARYAPWQIERGIVDGSFATALRCAWRQAKEAAKEALLAVNPEAIRIRQEIEMLSYKSARIDIEPMRRRLESQLRALAA